ncbi:hypothetical protein N7513_003224 [Penicillium frequentans]|uniref:Uncharacterized protein n=1 Tax=Penicillium frequentans TaxID=3151616 RepID=A0AAD6CJ56_9EURO|nr:hypothetical protein N7494_013235 [Penicillium glabrum]KAJ5557638.1 hypothetical protein N7513_003224 [Penicillium glabrum]
MTDVQEKTFGFFGKFPTSHSHNLQCAKDWHLGYEKLSINQRVQLNKAWDNAWQEGLNRASVDKNANAPSTSNLGEIGLRLNGVWNEVDKAKREQCGRAKEEVDLVYGKFAEVMNWIESWTGKVDGKGFRYDDCGGQHTPETGTPTQFSKLTNESNFFLWASNLYRAHKEYQYDMRICDAKMEEV